jgi:hypothetical protein
MSYDPALCAQCAYLTNEAYKLSSDSRYIGFFKQGYTISERLYATPSGWFAKPELYCVVFRYEKTGMTFFVFPGTRTFNDWLSNFKFKQVKGHEQLLEGVESGAAQIFVQIFAQTRLLEGLFRPRIVFTGHSLGAQLATLACMYNHIDCAYLFASPRVGSIAWADKFNAKMHNIYRIVNTEDIVPTMPLPAATGILSKVFGRLTFKHVGKPVCFTVNTGDAVDNHRMETYMNSLHLIEDYR